MIITKGELGGNCFGEHLRHIREYKHISQDDLARQVGISPGTLDNIEKGYDIPRRPIVHAMARVLDCDVRNLLYSRKYALAEKRRWTRKHKSNVVCIR
jgi:transcriptional regulator with XRE-family HTH domain